MSKSLEVKILIAKDFYSRALRGRVHGLVLQRLSWLEMNFATRLDVTHVLDGQRNAVGTDIFRD